MRRTIALALAGMVFCAAAAPAAAQVSIGIEIPGLSIGINQPSFPDFVQVPGYPVYYAPRLRSNYFFYDGLYWVYSGDQWYASDWYNGPWGQVDPAYVPLFVLRIPVRYYRNPPPYFRGWLAGGPPRWGQHWGNAWAQQHNGWDHWDRHAVPARAPLPVYQRQYSGPRYPQVQQQQALRSQNYHYQPRDAVAREHFQAQAAHAPAQQPVPVQQQHPAPGAREQQAAPGRREQQAAPARSEAPARQESPAAQIRQESPGTPARRESPPMPPRQESPGTPAQRSQPAAAPEGRPQREETRPRPPAQPSGAAVAPAQPPERSGPKRESAPAAQAAPASNPPVQRTPEQPRRELPQRPAAPQTEQPRPAAPAGQPPRPARENAPQAGGGAQRPNPEQGHDKERDKGDERGGQDRNK